MIKQCALLLELGKQRGFRMSFCARIGRSKVPQSISFSRLNFFSRTGHLLPTIGCGYQAVIGESSLQSKYNGRERLYCLYKVLPQNSAFKVIFLHEHHFKASVQLELSCFERAGCSR